MKFGVFDHVDRGGLALSDQFDWRLDYVAALYCRAGMAGAGAADKGV